MIVELVYYKKTGKYYSEGKYRTEAELLSDIWKEIQEFEKHPGLGGRWTEGYIQVDVPYHPHNHPRLIIV